MDAIISRSCIIRIVFPTIGLLLFTLGSGCDQLPSSLTILFASNKSFHKKFKWRAENFFDDPQVVALCRAIEKNDLEAIEQHIQQGADVNARGKGEMTPLMWAFPDDKLDRFVLLLEHGADPNVVITSALGVPSAFTPGDSVTTLSAKTAFSGYFDAVMHHGGDVHLKNGFGQPVINSIMLAPIGDTQSRLSLALQCGADIDSRWSGATPAMDAITVGHYDIAIYLYERGADFKAYRHDGLQRAVHSMLRKEARSAEYSSELKASYDRLFAWLVAHGEDIEQAREDLERWSKFSKVHEIYVKQWRAEVEAKRAKEALNANAVED